jgi:serine/threonine protein kinase
MAPKPPPRHSDFVLRDVRDTIPSHENPVVEVSPTHLGSAAKQRYGQRGVLGTGGMGEVALVFDRQIGRDVALKQLRPEARRDDVARARFAREARIQGQLEHPAVVPVYDLGGADDGSLYFTMKRVRGTSLGDILSALASGDAAVAKRFTRRRILTAFAQICLTAHYAHERGVVHRDIKPDNIMLGDYGEVYLLDWGLARIEAAPQDDPTDPAMAAGISAADGGRTRAGQVLGTLGYMAPEQARGEHATLDARADVYALGAILFEILTGQALYERDRAELMMARAIAGETDARPSVRAPGAEVAPELEALCVAATRADHEQRLPSARALHEALEAYLDGDRNLVERRAAAARHAAAAAGAAAVAMSHDTPARDETTRRAAALNEVGKALALDPSHADALRTLVRLLTNPPRQIPAAVEDAQQETWRQHIRRGALLGALIYAYISANGIFTWALGVHDARVFWIAHALWACALAAGIVTFARPTYTNLFCMFLFGTAASTWATTVYGPHLLVPLLLVVHAVLYAQVRHWRLRIAVIVIACVGWTVSIFGELWGLFPDTVRFVDGGMIIRSPAIDFPEILTTIYFYSAVLGVIVLPAVVVGFLRSSYHRADLQTRLQTWQLHQLVPEGAPTRSSAGGTVAI